MAKRLGRERMVQHLRPYDGVALSFFVLLTSLVAATCGILLWWFFDAGGGVRLAGAGALALMPMVLWVGAVVPLLGVRKIAIGQEGMVVHQRLGSHRFIPFGDLVKVSETPRGLAIQLPKSGFILDEHREEVRGQLVVEIERAWGDFLDRPRASKVDFLVRTESSRADWRDRLSAAGARLESYRDIALDPRQLSEIVSDPKAAPEQRVGAALALSSMDRSTAKDRVRLAVAGCAHPKLRVALQRASKGKLDEAALVEAEAEIEAQQEADGATE